MRDTESSFSAETSPPAPVSAGERTLATAELVLEIATAAAGERELDAILRAALDRLHGVVAFTGGSIALVDREELVIRAATGPFQDEAIGQRLTRGSSLSWRVIESLEPVRVDDLLTSEARVKGVEASKAVRSWLGCPDPVAWRWHRPPGGRFHLPGGLHRGGPGPRRDDRSCAGRPDPPGCALHRRATRDRPCGTPSRASSVTSCARRSRRSTA